MKKDNYKLVVYFISITIVLTIGVQIFWNIKEYHQNKSRMINEVRRSLDNAVEDYFANKTRKSFITINGMDSLSPRKTSDTIVLQTKSRRGMFMKIDSTLDHIRKTDTSKVLVYESEYGKRKFPFYKSRFIGRNLDSIISKVMISFRKDSIRINEINTYLISELKRNDIDLNYALKLRIPKWDGLRNNKYTFDAQELYMENISEKHLTLRSKSHYLPHRSYLEILFTNPTLLVLEKSLVSILLSFLLSISIIASLVYLLKTIYKQKQLAEIKNDLISNITHEFKTPIATVSTALEAMKNFNALNDKEKSEKYISIANSQINKLNVMVEKLLETATLNSEELALNKSIISINELLKSIVEKYQLINSGKEFLFKESIQETELNLDIFHFENAIGNIIDNAIKYGGNKISVELTSKNDQILIFIKDNGNGIHKSQKTKVFEQFYRIPTGNTHNVKGFGIGLFYTKTIIEKHHGSIDIIYDKNNNTLFKIELLNE